MWKADRPLGFLGSYSTPCLYKPASGPTQIVVAGAVELTEHRAKTGERLWWARGVTYAPVALPLVAGDAVYTVEPAAGGPPPCSQMLKEFDKNKNGKIELPEVSGESINEKTCTGYSSRSIRTAAMGTESFAEDEYNRSFNPDPPGDGLVRTRLKRLKDAIGEYYASPVAGDGKIYFVNKDGKVSMIQAGAKWAMLSSGDLGEQVTATPGIDAGRIYTRTEATRPSTRPYRAIGRLP